MIVYEKKEILRYQPRRNTKVSFTSGSRDEDEEIRRMEMKSYG